MDRRLAAILHADVVGYSRLMEGAETRTFRELKTLFDNVWLPALARHSGRLVNTAGDAMLVEFGSAVAAVRCAMELQVTMAARNTGRAPERHVLLRVGLNIGEVIVDGDNIFGDEVNLAARIQALAEPGTVIVSSRVREAVEGKVGFGFSDLGDQHVKNISRPVRVHRVLPADTGTDSATVLPGMAGAPSGPSPAAAMPPVPSARTPAPSVPSGRSAPAGGSLAPTISAPVSRPQFQPSGAPPPAQPAPYASPPFTPVPPPFTAPVTPPAPYGATPASPASPPFQSQPFPPPPVPAGSPFSLPTAPMPPEAPAPVAWRLVGADRTGTQVDMRLEAGLLVQADGVVFGRLPRYCHLTFDNDSISRRHARFRLGPEGSLTVEDLGSTNGTAVDGRKIEPFRPVPVREGSRVSLGEIKAVISRA